MKITGKNLKRRLYGVSRLRDRVRRARYFRGHGVHSPFVYKIVRQVFMRRHLTEDNNGDATAMYGSLIAVAIPHKRAVQLTNLSRHIKASCWCIDTCPDTPGSLVIVSRAVGAEKLHDYAAEAHKTGSTLAIMSPYMTREREEACRNIIREHTETSVDNRGYLLIFNNGLPKQHFRL